MGGVVTAVSRSAEHAFGKPNRGSIRLLSGGRGDRPAQPLQAARRLPAGAHAGAVLDRDGHGNLVRKAGVMGVVLAGGEVRPGGRIRVALPSGPHRPLERV